MLNATRTSGRSVSAANNVVCLVAVALAGMLAVGMFFIAFGQFKSGVMV